MKRNKLPLTRATTSHLLWILLILLACTLVLWPLSKRGMFISDDGEWMVIRLSAFFQSLREGQFPVRFLGRLNHSYGYPVANFLYPGFLYLGSFIHGLGVPFVETIKLIFALSVVGSSVMAFLWLRVSFGALASFIGSLSFLFSPYILFDLYERGSVGEVLAFFPAFVGLYSIASKKRWLFALSVAGLIVSHNTLAILFLGVFSLYLLWKGAYEFFLPLALGMGMSAFFWLPAIFERRFVIFDATIVSRPLEYFVMYKDASRLGFVAIISALLILLRKDEKRLPEKNFFLIIFSASIILATALTTQLWTWETLVKLVQFPYRFLAVSIVTGSWIVASFVQNVSFRTKCGLFVLFVGLWGLTLWSTLTSIEYSNQPEGYYTTNEATTNVADEYMPRWVREKPQRRPVQKLEFISGRGTIDIEGGSTRATRVKITALDSSVVQLNTIYYPGWGVLLDGVPVDIDHENEQGVMRMRVPSGTHTMRAEFRETPARLASDLVSLVSLVACVILAVRERRRHV